MDTYRIPVLQILIAAGSPENKHAAEVVSEVKKDNNLLLCTLLLGNVSVNSLLSILMADLTSGVWQDVPVFVPSSSRGLSRRSRCLLFV
jgi:hypothetical protein